MFDRRLRTTKERLLHPLARTVAGRVPATALTAAGLAFSIGAGVAAWRELPVLAVTCWLVGRALDGLDGEVARAAHTASDRGGYADLLFDTIGYAAVPIGIAFGADDVATWRLAAILLAAFYVNSVSWLMLSALIEKHRTSTGRHPTSITMPTGLVEGVETIVLLAIALAIPSIARTVFVVMAVAVGIGVVQRAFAARRLLRTTSADS